MHLVEIVWRCSPRSYSCWHVAHVGVRPGMDVLDVACGHGRIANRLAEHGCPMTGLDATPAFLDRARRDAAPGMWSWTVSRATWTLA
ncbi:MAG TPA: class I SAM-dependent methyltransferase, partial [Actinomycetota bacterium]|nr:class I SAM-dependent methyltransferase [Actinomycetota bacterium]